MLSSNSPETNTLQLSQQNSNLIHNFNDIVSIDIIVRYKNLKYEIYEYKIFVDVLFCLLNCYVLSYHCTMLSHSVGPKFPCKSWLAGVNQYSGKALLAWLLTWSRSN